MGQQTIGFGESSREKDSRKFHDFSGELERQNVLKRDQFGISIFYDGLKQGVSPPAFRLLVGTHHAPYS